MFVLRTLGSVDLRDPAKAHTNELVLQPVGLALVTFLAIGARGGCARRDVLADLFWGEVDAEHARALLRQALFRTRQAVGKDAIRNRGAEEVGLGADWECDAWAFTDALDAGDRAAAIEWYKGPFLDGFHVSGAARFSQWVDERRYAFERRCAQALEDLVVEAVGDMDHRRTIEWGERLLEVDPYHTPVAVEVMRAMAQRGDRANAIVFADRHGARLKADLEAVPSLEFRDLYAGLREGTDPGTAQLDRVRRTAAPQPAKPKPPEEPLPPSASADSVASSSRGDAPAGGGAEADDSDALPEQIGPYRVIRELGAGGMGVVYAAEQRQPVRRLVALKMMKAGLDTREVIGRFEAERQALAVMEHPGIAKVFDGGTSEQGRPYFVMELVRGVRLTEYADDNQLTTRERIELFIAICSAVQHAHQKGVIHRDLKPSNVLVGESDGRPAPKVIDFGIAKATGFQLSERTVVTTYGQALGTLAYMSPEQAEMSGLDIDTRTDIYALGVMLYELLTGVVPVDPLLTSGPAFVMQLVSRDTPAPTPGSRLAELDAPRRQRLAAMRRTEVDALRRELGGDLQWIILKAIEKDRARRYETANGLGMDLERYLRNEPVVARAPTTRYRVGKFVRRNRAGVAAAAGVALALAGGAAAATVGMLRARAAEQLAEHEAATSAEVSRFLTGLFQFSDPSIARGGQITAREMLDIGAVRVDSALADQPLVRAELMYNIGRSYYYLNLMRDAATHFERASALFRESAPPGDARYANGLAARLFALARIVPPAEIEAGAKEAIAAFAELPEPETFASGMVYSVLSSVLMGSGRGEEGKQAVLDAMARFERFPDQRTPRRDLADYSPAQWRVISLVNLANALDGERRFAEALAMREESTRLHRETFGQDHPDHVLHLSNLAESYQMFGRSAEAERNLAQALDIGRRVQPGRPSVYWMGAAGNYVHVLSRLGRFDDAEAVLREGMGLAPDDGELQFEGGRMRARAGDLPGAARLLEGAARSYGSRGGRVPVWVSIAHSGVLLDLGNVAAGCREAEQAVAATSAVSSNPRYAALSLAALGRCRAARGASTDAADLFERALAVQEDLHTDYPDHLYFREDLAGSLGSYAALLRALGRVGEAVTLEDRAAALLEG